MLTRSKPSANESSDSRYGVPMSFNKYKYPKRVDPPTLTLDELRAEHERLIVPLLQTDSQAK
jgi:hypothetical protein